MASTASFNGAGLRLIEIKVGPSNATKTCPPRPQGEGAGSSLVVKGHYGRPRASEVVRDCVSREFLNDATALPLKSH